MVKLKRILLKLSGEALSGDKGFGFDEETCLAVARQVKQLNDKGMEIAIVIGGGNFWRGRNSSKIIERTKSDQIGMLGTVMNCIYVSEIFRTLGMKTEVFTPFLCGSFTALFSKDAAVEALESGKIVFFAGGTGHPYFSTDTGTTLRAIEMMPTRFCWRRLWTAYMTAIPRQTPMQRSLTGSVSRRLWTVGFRWSILRRRSCVWRIRCRWLFLA